MNLLGAVVAFMSGLTEKHINGVRTHTHTHTRRRRRRFLVIRRDADVHASSAG